MSTQAPARTRSTRTHPVVAREADGPQPQAAGLFLGYAVLVFFAFVYLYPFVIQVTTAFKTNADAVGEPASPGPGPVHDRAPSTGSPHRLPALVGQLRDGDGAGHRRAGVLRLARRLCPGPDQVPRARARCSPRSSP